MQTIQIFNIETLTQQVREALPKAPGYDHTLQISGIASESVEQILSRLSGQDFSIEEFNGVDQDWSGDVVINEKKYEVWGSARSGGFCMNLSDNND